MRCTTKGIEMTVFSVQISPPEAEKADTCDHGYPLEVRVGQTWMHPAYGAFHVDKLEDGIAFQMQGEHIDVFQDTETLKAAWALVPQTQKPLPVSVQDVIARGRTLRQVRGGAILEGQATHVAMSNMPALPAGTLVSLGPDGSIVRAEATPVRPHMPQLTATRPGDELGTLRRELQETRAALQTATARVEGLERYMGPSMLARFEKLGTRRGG